MHAPHNRQPQSQMQKRPALGPGAAISCVRVTVCGLTASSSLNGAIAHLSLVAFVLSAFLTGVPALGPVKLGDTTNEVNALNGFESRQLLDRAICSLVQAHPHGLRKQRR